MQEIFKIKIIVNIQGEMDKLIIGEDGGKVYIFIAFIIA